MGKVAAAVQKAFGAKARIAHSLTEIEAQIAAKEAEQSEAVIADESGSVEASIDRDLISDELRKLRDRAAELRGAQALIVEKEAAQTRASRVQARKDARQSLEGELARLRDHVDAFDRAADALAEILAEIQDTERRITIAAGNWAGLAKEHGGDTQSTILLGTIVEANKHFWTSLGYRLRAFPGVRSGMYTSPESARMGPRFRTIALPAPRAE